MIKRQHIALIIALVAGLAAVILLNQHIKNIRRTVEEETLRRIGKMVDVVVAARDIKAGQRIEEYMMGFDTVPAKFAQPNVIRLPARAIGKMAAVNIVSGQQIASTLLTTKKITQVGGLAVRIPSGKRGVTFPMDKISAVGGMVKPGDYVDIMGTFPVVQGTVDGKQVTQPIMHTFLQNVLVLALGEQLEGGRGSTKSETVTLALAPLEAQLVAYAQAQGKIRLILRAPLDTATQSIAPVDANALAQYIAAQMGMSQQEKSSVISPKGPSVEIYRGQNREEMPLKEK